MHRNAKAYFCPHPPILYFYFTINKSTTRDLKSKGSAFVIS